MESIKDLQIEIKKLNNQIIQIKEHNKTKIDDLNKSIENYKVEETTSGKTITKLREIQNALNYINMKSISVEQIYEMIKQEKELIKDIQEKIKSTKVEIQKLQFEIQHNSWEDCNNCPICMSNEATLNLGCCKAKYCALCVFKIEKDKNNLIRCAICRQHTFPDKYKIVVQPI
jgi:DNA repair exonuclease SbcCD ATPase subunit